MTVEPSTQHQPSVWRRFLALKSMLVALSLVGLLASNIASLVSAGFHDLLHSALWRVLSIGGHAVADRAMANSPKARVDEKVKAKTADLDSKNKRLEIAHEVQGKELQTARAKGQQLAQQLELNGKQAKATVAAVHQRLAKGVSRNVAALPGESIPYLGVGLTLAVTSMDIYDACQTMKDFNALLRMMGQGEENPELCGRKVPTVDEVLDRAKQGWRSSVQMVADEAKALKMKTPEVRLPTKDEVAKATCFAVSVPYLCSEK